jgi:hypothetical protein
MQEKSVTGLRCLHNLMAGIGTDNCTYNPSRYSSSRCPPCHFCTRNSTTDKCPVTAETHPFFGTRSAFRKLIRYCGLALRSPTEAKNALRTVA